MSGGSSPLTHPSAVPANRITNSQSLSETCKTCLQTFQKRRVNGMPFQPGRLRTLTGTAWSQSPTAQDRELGEDLARQRPAKGSGRPPGTSGGRRHEAPPEGQLLHCVPSCPAVRVQALKQKEGGGGSWGRREKRGERFLGERATQCLWD